MRHVRHALLVALLIVGSFTLTLTLKPGLTQAETAPVKLADHMGAIGDAMNSLRRTVRDAEKDADSLKTLTTMQEHILTAKGMVPTKLAELPAAEQAVQVKRYRLAMADLLAEVCVTEKMVLEGRNADAFEQVKKLNSMKMQGHEAFKVD